MACTALLLVLMCMLICMRVLFVSSTHPPTPYITPCAFSHKHFQPNKGVEGSSAATRALSNMAPAHAADLFLNLLATTWDDRYGWVG